MKAASAFFAAVALLSASSAPAQLKPEAQTGSRIETKPVKIDAKRAGMIMKSFARCVYRANPALAVRLLANSDPVSIDFAMLKTTPQKLTDALGMGDCLGEEMGTLSLGMGLKMSAMRLRPLMAEEDYLFRHKAAPALPEGATEALNRSYVGAEKNNGRARTLVEFADCIVFRDTARADALLRTVPNSNEEGAAARGLAPSLGACLVQGQTVELTAPAVRAMLADGLWTRYAKIVGTVR